MVLGLFTLGVGVLGVLGGGSKPAAATSWTPILPYIFSSMPLEFSNGQKIVTGRYNRLHTVYQDFGNILYSMSSDGFTWSTPVAIACGAEGKYPAIAADSYGKLGVVWHDVATNSIFYVYHDGTSWSMPMQITASGTEPSIVARGNNVYIAWTTLNGVRYATFPTLSPSLVTGEVVDSTACSSTFFRFPSITLVNQPCNPPVPVIGFLRSVDEQTSGPGCLNITTSVGPRVFKRDNSLGVWNLAWSDLRLNSAAGSTVEPISLSLSSRFSSGDLYVGYSDVQNSVARTKLGHARGTFWSTAATLNAQRNHIHVRANESASSPVGTFRIAQETSGSYNASYRDGVWAGTGALAWSGPSNVVSTYAARPHASWWKRCSAGWYTDLRVLAEEDLSQCIPCPPTSLGIEYEYQTPCPPTGPITGLPFPCHSPSLSTAVLSDAGGVIVAVDATDAGVVKTVTDRGATIVTPTGETIEVTWRTGRLAWSSDSSFGLTGATEADLTFTSATVKFKVERQGALDGYDQVPAVCQR